MPTVGKVAFDMHGGEIIGLLGPNETCKTVPFNLPELAAITLEPGGRDVRWSYSHGIQMAPPRNVGTCRPHGDRMTSRLPEIDSTSRRR
jgi:hypothetical protein